MTDTVKCNENREAFFLGGLTAAPGERIQGELALGDGKFLLPAAILHGKQPGKTVLITAGIHGGEYVGIQAAVELAEKLKIEKVAGTVIIVKVVNRPAFEGRTGSMVWEDGENLNRVFPGDPRGSASRQLADAIVRELFSKADFYIDLHSGDDYEKLAAYVYYAGKASPTVVEASRKMAQQVDVPYMVCSDVASGGAYNYAASSGIPSILIERGGMGDWSAEEVRSMRRDVRNILCSLGIYQGQKDYRTYYPLDVSDVTYQSAAHAGLWYPAKMPGDVIRKGEYLGWVRDYEGNALEICSAEYDGVILYQTGSLQVLEEGPMIAYGRVRKTYDDRKERITEYWGKRSESFLEQKKRELHSAMADRWLSEISRQIPWDRPLKILDVGCGTGFFSVLLAKAGHQVIGCDLTPEMVVGAKQLAREEAVSCRFRVMDAEELDFADETFDLVISRNLTWTLPDAARAYREWHRVLKPEGVLLNFDANYGAADFSDYSDLPTEHSHRELGDDMLRECEEIKRQLPISSYVRPAWDLEILGKTGFSSFAVDLAFGKKIYVEKDEFYNPTPVFMIRARKEEERA